MFKLGLRVPAWGLLLTLFIGFLGLGLYGSPFSPLQSVSEIEVEAEYINGLLTVSGILFGIWAIILSERSRMGSDNNSFAYKEIILPSFYLSLGLLIISVVFLTMTGFGWYSPSFLFFFTALSCIINASLLIILVKHR